MSRPAATHARSPITLTAFEHWRRQGVRFRTRVISSAASAGAVMVSLGDERVAVLGARLIYHNARATNASELTASETTALHSALRELDEGMLGLLASRALNAPSDTPKVPFKAERSDRKVLERLHGLVAGNHASPKVKRRRLARTVGRAVNRNPITDSGAN